MVEHEALDEPRVGIRHVLHLHQLDHVQVNRLKLLLLLATRRLRRTVRVELVLLAREELLLLPNRKDGVDGRLREGLGKRLVDLGRERGVGDVDEGFVVRLGTGGEGDLEVVEEGREGVFGDFETVGENSGVDPLRGVARGLVEELPYISNQCVSAFPRLAKNRGGRGTEEARTHQRGERPK